MSDGPCLSLRQEPHNNVLLDGLHNFAEWIDLNHPPVPMIAGMLELLGNELYRQGRYTEGSEIKHVVGALRGGDFGGCA